MKGIFGKLFDFNHNGKIDPAEQAMEFAVLDEMMQEEEEQDEAYSIEELDEYDLFDGD